MGVSTFNKAKIRRWEGSINSHSQNKDYDIIRVEDELPKIGGSDIFNSVQILLDSRMKCGASGKVLETYLLQGVI